MIVERLAKSLMVLSKDGVFTRESLERLSGLGGSIVESFLNELLSDGAITRVGEGYRVNMRPHALIRYFMNKGLSVDLEEISDFLPWDEFEALIRLIFEEWGFRVVSRLRVPVVGTRVEFDVIAYREPRVLLIEAKRWRRVSGSLSAIVKRHLEKVELVSREPEVLMNRLGVRWGEALLIPVVITWHKAGTSMLEGVPIVSIYQVNSFIMELDGIVDYVRAFRVSWRHL
ncbi:MAG: hypothetical protein AT718_00200 [Vulcanisaeta sp. JCHS_4]|jgi:hypothetical protein|nr:MAG: hypothetical protein AT718_00200 [Vulcanisaeta sp. JCHS_4]